MNKKIPILNENEFRLYEYLMFKYRTTFNLNLKKLCLSTVNIIFQKKINNGRYVQLASNENKRITLTNNEHKQYLEYKQAIQFSHSTYAKKVYFAKMQNILERACYLK